MKKCERCSADIEGAHYNTKWCSACKEIRRKELREKERVEKIRDKNRNEELEITGSDISYFVDNIY